MVWDIGFRGLAILVGFSLLFGLVAQLALWRVGNRWQWLIGMLGYFVGGLFTSEVLFGTATVEQLQPIEDGLVFDEAMFGGLIVGLVAVAVTWYLTRRTRIHGPMAV